MGSRRRWALALVAAGLVALLLVVAAVPLRGPTETSYVTTTVAQTTTLTTEVETTATVYAGTSATTEYLVVCTATSYVQAAAVEASSTLVTITSGNTTYTEYVTTAVGPASYSTVAKSTYESSTNLGESPGYSFANAAPGSSCSPSECWTYTSCTYAA